MDSEALSVLYDGYNALVAVEDKSTVILFFQKNLSLRFLMQLTETFANMLTAAKSGEKAKRLGAKFLPQFFKYFPSLGEEIFTLLLDNTEDQDVEVLYFVGTLFNVGFRSRKVLFSPFAKFQNLCRF